MTTIQSEYSDDRDLVNQLLGQVQMAKSFSKIADVVSLTKLQYIKENKLYKALTGKKGIDFDGNEIADVGNWDGFCQMLGLSRSKVDEDLLNINIFGEDALKSMTQIGIGYRELRQYRKLPEDQKTALIEVAKAGDKEALVELAEEFIAKNAKEKELLKKQVNEAKKELEISEAYNADTRKERDDLKLKLKKYELNTVPMDERLHSFGKKVASIQSEMDRLFEEKRQLLDMLYQMSLELMDKDPEYVRGEYYPLPKTMQNAISALNGSSIFSLDQAKQFHRSLWDKFLSDLEDIQDTTFNLHNESLTINENN